MAQRRLRALGMIGAIGATDRQVRRVMSANGVAVGTVGAILGVALGLGVWLALTPAFEGVVGHRYDPFVLPWWAVLAGAVLAILTALAASWWPARAAARVPGRHGGTTFPWKSTGCLRRVSLLRMGQFSRDSNEGPSPFRRRSSQYLR
jgi:predicted lysophospholipase L1 biosynthesis ABC-type transport system permease subunit